MSQLSCSSNWSVLLSCPMILRDYGNVVIAFIVISVLLKELWHHTVLWVKPNGFPLSTDWLQKLASPGVKSEIFPSMTESLLSSLLTRRHQILCSLRHASGLTRGSWHCAWATMSCTCAAESLTQLKCSRWRHRPGRRSWPSNKRGKYRVRNNKFSLRVAEHPADLEVYWVIFLILQVLPFITGRCWFELICSPNYSNTETNEIIILLGMLNGEKCSFYILCTQVKTRSSDVNCP